MRTSLSLNFHDSPATLELSLRVIETPISPPSSGLSFAPPMACPRPHLGWLCTFSYHQPSLPGMISVKPSPGSAQSIPAKANGPKWDVGEAVSQLSWDDLRIIKTLSDCSNRAATAKKLGINVSTVTRRVVQVEKTLGVALFDHRKAGYLLTAEGAELRALAERVELDIVSVTRRVSRAGQGPLGKLRITTSDSLLLYFLTPIIADFKALNEGISIEVLVGNQTLSLARDESDIAVRATRKPADTLVGRKAAVADLKPLVEGQQAIPASSRKPGAPFIWLGRQSQHGTRSRSVEVAGRAEIHR